MGPGRDAMMNVPGNPQRASCTLDSTRLYIQLGQRSYLTLGFGTIQSLDGSYSGPSPSPHRQLSGPLCVCGGLHARVNVGFLSLSLK